jgi:hypothetical protein
VDEEVAEEDDDDEEIVEEEEGAEEEEEEVDAEVTVVLISFCFSSVLMLARIEERD